MNRSFGWLITLIRGCEDAWRDQEVLQTLLVRYGPGHYLDSWPPHTQTYPSYAVPDTTIR